MIEQVLLTPKIVAHLMGINIQTVCGFIRDGRMPAVNMGSIRHPRWFVPTTAIANMISGGARWKYPRQVKRRWSRRQNALIYIEKELANKSWEFEEEND